MLAKQPLCPKKGRLAHANEALILAQYHDLQVEKQGMAMRAVQEIGMIGKAIDKTRPVKTIERMPLSLRSGTKQNRLCSTELRRNQPPGAPLPISKRKQDISSTMVYLRLL
ncbi:MAG: hypothetical protein AAF221_09960 [Pseudomonadota bacterium]